MEEEDGVSPKVEQQTGNGGWRVWLSAMGPGAIVASLTIGTGELVFSTRAGALFGYRVLGVFALVLLMKWALVFASARYWVLSGEHPLRRWAELPGPRGWLPMTLLLVAAPAFPVWVSFHSGTIGTLVGDLTGTTAGMGGSAPLIWGVVVLLGVLVLSATGGYARQEKFQAVVVGLMLVSVIVALVMLKPDWGALFAGFLQFDSLRYPDWALALPAFADRPIWVESATYAGVIGGSGYDYLAYVAWLRDKHGQGAARKVDPALLVRLVRADATLSFLTVLAFSTVFVACGTIILGPQKLVPAGSDLLTLQAQFVGVVGPWLRPLYFTGALLALVGTLYGTIEVAPAVLRELWAPLARNGAGVDEERQRRWAVRWAGWGALGILLSTLGWRWVMGARDPFDLVALVTPANLMTGVFACGWISLLNVWLDRRKRVRSMGVPLLALNLLGGVAFSLIGLRAAWDHGRWSALGTLLAVLAAGWILAAWRDRATGGGDRAA